MSDNGYYGSSAHPEDRHDDRMETDERDRQILQQAADQDRADQAPRSRSRSRSVDRGGDRDRDHDRNNRRAGDSSRSPVRRDSRDRDRERDSRRPDAYHASDMDMDSSTYRRDRDTASRSPPRKSAKLESTRDRHSKNYRDDEEVANPGNQLYVRGLSFRTTEPELRDLFGKYGELTEVNVVKDPHLNECRGFAFVKFANPEDAASAIKGEHDQDFHGRRLIVELSRRAKPRPKTPGEYLGRLSTREMELRGDRRRRIDDRDRPYGRGSYGGDRGYDRGGYDDRDRGYGGRGGGRGGYDERDRYDRYDDRSGSDRGYGGGARGSAGGRGGYDDRDYGRRY